MLHTSESSSYREIEEYTQSALHAINAVVVN